MPEALLSSSLEASAQDYLDRSRLLKQQGKFPEAESCLREVVCLKPNFWGAWNNLGTLLQNQNRLEEALRCYETALLHHPNFAEAIANRASLWQLDDELERAKIGYLQAIQLKPEYVPAHFNLATIYKQQGRLAAAVQHYLEVVNRRPDYHEAHFALAQILEYQDRYEEAEHHYQQAEQFSSTPWQISLVRAHLRLRFCDWQDYDLHTQHLIDLVSDPIQRQQCGLSPLALSTFPISLDLHRAMAEAQSCSLVKQAIALQEKQPALRFSQQRSSHPKLRIGYLSPDFREHAVGRLVCQLFQHHDRDRFEIFAYSTVDVNDEITQQVRLGCDRYVDLSPLSTADAAKRIHADDIDILIDLAGYTIGNLASVLALQPAPIQIEWLGYPDTMGAPFIQYILADEWLIPPEHKPCFSEEVIYLPMHLFLLLYPFAIAPSQEQS
jgi:protein O-GlcNAc transferase